MCINSQRLLCNTYYILQIAANKLAIIRCAEKFLALRLKAQPESLIDNINSLLRLRVGMHIILYMHIIERVRNQMTSNLLTDALNLSIKLAHEDSHSWYSSYQITQKH